MCNTSNASFSKINDNLKELTEQEKEDRGQLSKELNGEGFDINDCGVYLDRINQTYRRPIADATLKQDMILTLAQQIRQCINRDYESKGFCLQGNEIKITNVDQLPESGSEDEKIVYYVWTIK